MFIREIRSQFARYRPVLVARDATPRAAVAVVLTSLRGQPEVLLIQRARKANDPWSGHMAFPGGHLAPEDAGAEQAARRETHEEVGLSLAQAEALGRLDDLQGQRKAQATGLVISAFVYHLPEPDELVLQQREVEHAFFFPFAELANPARHVRHRHRDAGDWVLPGIIVGEHERHIVWGLTYRFIEIMHKALAQDFPRRGADAPRPSR